MKDFNDGFSVIIAEASHEGYADEMARLLRTEAQMRDAGIAERSSEYLATKIRERKAVMAFYGNELAGFCYMECWENKHYACLSGLVVIPKFRGRGLATRLLRLLFSLARLRFPEAMLYSLTNARAAMHIYASLGFVPIPFSGLTTDEVFWKACGTPKEPLCHNCEVLEASKRRYCLCTAMRFDPTRHPHDPIPVEIPQEIVDFVEQAEVLPATEV